MTDEELKSWRKGERVRLIAAREGLDAVMERAVAAATRRGRELAG